MNLPIPFFSLSRQWNNLKPAIEPALQQILDTQSFVGGKAVATFEEKLATYLSANHVISCNSGTDALWLALKALDLKPNEIVLTSPFSFIASSSEITSHGGHPVFIDIDPDTYNMSPSKLTAWLEKYTTQKNGHTYHIDTGYRVAGILPINIFGQCADYPALSAIAKKWHLWMVEDAAQSIGSTLNNKHAGTFGDIACFSFYPTKNLGALGDAGATVTHNPDLAKTLRLLRNHGRNDRYTYEMHGINSRMDALQAAALSVKLEHLDELNIKRRSIAQQYRSALKDLKCINLPKEISGYHTYHQYCIQIEDQDAHNVRNRLQEHLTAAQIGTNIFYPSSFTSIPYLATDKRLATQCPVTDHVTHTILALPVFPELTTEEVSYITTAITQFVAEHLTARAPQTITQPSMHPQSVS